jgi:phage/plasmid-like protein (TIGR03299 family)
MGSLRGGKYVWALANLGAGFKIAGKDEVKGYLLVAIPHQQGKSFVIKITTIRVVCMNTLMMALRGAGNEFRMVHRREFNKDVMQEAKQTLGIAREQVKEFGETANFLKKMKVSKEKAFEMFSLVYAPGKKFKMDDAPEKVKRVLDIYEKAPGADPGTGWGVLNAVTYYADHVASRTEDKRLSNAWFGKTGAQKEKVLELLTVR